MNKSSKEFRVTTNNFLYHSLSKDIYTQNDIACECSRYDIKTKLNRMFTIIIARIPSLREGNVFSRVSLFTVRDGVSHDAIGQSQVIWGPPPPTLDLFKQACSLGIRLSDLFKCVHLGTPVQPYYPYPSPILVPVPPPPVHPSIGKRVVGLRLKGLLVSVKFGSLYPFCSNY